ncbi:MATE family efflux transporter [Phenylobacterium sp. Root77]|uniref:MATE family efflux transporter n=1 Tax=unclassified Phenylobacterium TaxID=2640670 RepID=UPI0006F8B6AA|nr:MULTISPECIES: MATE family efflux transporter [unclassified Phenylobacterium]KQW72045.1 MATE family efflux transporter [Phenylobacterium sp. Root1277]KQW94966.1 MATE family efflux transporter [Phenylobacterium sp. Root1290]KRC44660.1 MATE family efflux transporter [Phenylobacterium sp. Root77]
MADPAQAALPSGEREIDVVRTETAELWKLSWPVVLSRLGIMVMGLSDAIVVGRYSATHLGYHALAWAPTSVVVTMCVGLLTGVQVMTARRIGQGRREMTGAVLRRGLVYSFWIGMISMVVTLLAGPTFLHVIGLEKDLADGAARAMLIFALSLPGYAFSVAASFWLEGLGKPKPGAVMMWLANGVNLLLLLLLVPGTFGLPAMGAVGGAWATTGARTFLALAVLAYIWRMPEAKALGVFDKPERDRPSEVEQRRIGYGAGASNFFEVAAFASMNIFAGWMGGLSVAAWAVVLNVAALVFMVPLGLSTGTAVMVGRAYGARDSRGVTRAGLIGFGMTAVFGLVISLVIWPTAGLISQAYTSDKMVLAMASAALVLSCLFFLVDALQVVIAQALRARGDVWLPTFTHLTSYVLVMMPLAWFLAIRLEIGLNGIVWAVIAASFLSAGLLSARFWQLARRGL